MLDLNSPIIEVWSEKGTVRGVLKPILDKYGVGFRVLHGFGSATTLNEIANTPHDDLQALYVGDWDPSGLYMSERDLPERLKRYGGYHVQLERIALAKEDVRRGTELPSFSADDKRGDRRYRWFVENYGRRCWELDASRTPTPTVGPDPVVVPQSSRKRLWTDRWQRTRHRRA